MDPAPVIHRNLGSAAFSFYTPEEIKKLSVLQVTNIEAFDGLGHAAGGGVYDSRLGPCRRFEVCATCRSSEETCEGHMAHIVLPLPVINPVLMQTLELLVKFTCFSCHHLRFDRLKLEVHLVKLEALDYGLDYLIEDIDEMVEHCATEYTDNLIDILIKKLQKMVRSAIKAKKIPSKSVANVCTIVERKKKLMKEFWNQNVGPSCNSCKVTKKPAVLNSRTFFMISEKVDDVISDDETQKEHEAVKVQKVKRLRTDKVKRIIHSLWRNEEKALRTLFPFLDIDCTDSKCCPTDVFFWDVLNVAAPRFQPLRIRDDRTFVHETRAALIEILKGSKLLEDTMKEIQTDDKDVESDPDTAADGSFRDKEKEFLKKANKVYHLYDKLQLLCNRLYNSEMNPSREISNPGVIQLLEKKQGLFRNNMMGKRVNFAARTVISPDPYITSNELGVPVIFALKLTYPQIVTPFNLKSMQKAVLNGPLNHPGAVAVRLEDGFLTRLKPNENKQRKVISERLESAIHRSGQPVIVYRHLVTGDVVLFNRQPSLHRPSIMAHIARILPAEKTFRMHYSNCKAYNADFDGDEMNVHFPQSELARAEAYQIASVNHQYLTPKDGSPLSGLIQDHIVAAALLSVRGTFFTRDDYHELIYGSLSFLNQKIITVPPAIIHPKPLWTGKQLITTLIMNIVPSGSPLPTVMYACKVKPKAFIKRQPQSEYHGYQLKADEMCESQVLIIKGEHLSGIIDKSSIGNQQHGLIHVCYEIYGGQVSTNLLTAFARLSTNYLQCHTALTLGIEDILVVDSANKKRQEIIASSNDVGKNAVLNSIAAGSEILSEDMIREKMQAAHVDREGRGLKLLDSGFKGETDKLNNQISGACLDGLMKKFPDNNLQLMIQAGAKGGTVNALQISCLLGQIELEGRRVPLMMSGKTLPSFVPYDTTPRAGGFIAGRFLTGIRPQEFFFHCMAGREGLVDTAVKTASSGYLQRCIIKHMEGLMVNYDMTVRNSDGSIVQFLYGEDGLDVTNSQMISPDALPILIRNKDVLKPSETEAEKIRSDLSKKRVSKYIKKVKKWESFNGPDRRKHVRGSAFLEHCSHAFEDKMETDDGSEDPKKDVIESWFSIDPAARKEINMRWLPCPDPLSMAFCSDQLFGLVSERIEQMIQKYVSENPDNLLIESDEGSISPLLPNIEHHSPISSSATMTKNDFFSTYCHRYMKSMSEPGEAVGVLVGHSIGEPSTQMTLNTFHFAGRGDMNVTLGIPRLREIIMTASENITNPSMDIPFRSDIELDEKKAAAVRLRLGAVRVSDVLREVVIKESLVLENRLELVYDITFEFLKYKHFKKMFNVNPSQILMYVENEFIPIIRQRMDMKIKDIEATVRPIEFGKKEKQSSKDNDDDEGDIGDEQKKRDRESSENAKRAVEDDDDSSSGDEGADGDTLSSKRKAKQSDENNFQEPEGDDEGPGDGEEDGERVDDEKENQKELGDDFMNTHRPRNDFQVTEDKKKKRVAAVIEKSESATKKEAGSVRDYDFDSDHQKWCRVVLALDLKHKLDVANLIEEAAKSCYIHKIGQIRRAFLVKDSQAGKRADGFDQIIKTEGVSFLPLVRFIDSLDLNRVYSNDVHAIARTYGIEAGGRAVRREIKNVFAVYGITVDPRHLSLIADYMTFSGRIRGMNRGALSYNSSPLQQMSFESTALFMREACLTGQIDELTSPSASIFAGIPPKLGTGCFALRQQKVQAPRSKITAERKGFASLSWSPIKGKTIKRRTRIIIPMMEKKAKF